MKTRWRGILGLAGLTVVLFAAWQLSTPAQQAGPPPKRFTFQVVQSFDAKYLGDTKGHLGRSSLLGSRPDVALGDPVYHGEAKVGTISGLTWDRVKDSLEVEFDPVEFALDARGKPIRRNRITVGEEVWVPMGGTVEPKAPG